MKEVIEALNELLADSKVFAQNLHNFHWNIQCMHFFELHEKLGELYDTVGDDTDIFAERILALGGTPMSTYSEYLRTAGIPERKLETKSDKIIQAVIEDLYATERKLNEVRKIAVTADDEGTNALMGEKLLCVQKAIWMWSAHIHERPNLERGVSEPTGDAIPDGYVKMNMDTDKESNVQLRKKKPSRVFNK